MAEALFSFYDVESARRAAQRVAEALPDSHVALHGNAAPNERMARTLDEAVTGGMLSTMYHLVEGLFDWQASPHGAGDYQEIIDKGGAVVRVDAATEPDRMRVDSLMRDVGCARRTAWSTGCSPPIMPIRRGCPRNGADGCRTASRGAAAISPISSPG